MNPTTLDPQVTQLESGRPVYNPTTWLRLPRPRTRCPISGLSRSSLVELVRPGPRNQFKPPVEARILKRKGAARGICLVSQVSLLRFINGLPSTTEDAQ